MPDINAALHQLCILLSLFSLLFLRNLSKLQGQGVGQLKLCAACPRARMGQDFNVCKACKDSSDLSYWLWSGFPVWEHTLGWPLCTSISGALHAARVSQLRAGTMATLSKKFSNGTTFIVSLSSVGSVNCKMGVATGCNTGRRIITQKRVDPHPKVRSGVMLSQRGSMFSLELGFGRG
jgi:hypothetical protein